jgi:mono/diheme cytochrome c family protein
VPRRAVTWLPVAALALTAALADAQIANTRPRRPEVRLPDGPVRQVILKSCTACHGIDEYGYYAMSRESWARLVERMKTAKSGNVEGAVISDSDREILLDWLVAEFGPDATPFERQYVIPTLTPEDLLSDAEARALLARACASCHASTEAFRRASFTQEQWRATLVGKIASGAELLVDEVDPLIDWLMGGGR